ncbi:MAG: DUF721 domain-containing protein [Candidatus Obscuribacterales bacterium]|nr:DUF721 domain-containing protein [Candidatus Obscuribacterales bacterium]
MTENPPQPENKKKGSSTQGARRKRKGFICVSSVLSSVVDKFGLETRMKEHTFMSMWQYVVGEPLSSLSRPIFIDYKRNLVVGVKDSSVASELSFRKVEILKSLKTLARSVGISIAGVRFDIKHYARVLHEEKSMLVAKDQEIHRIVDPTREELESVELSADAYEELDRMGQTISTCESGEEVRSKILSIYERELRQRQWLLSKGAPRCLQCGLAQTRLHGSQSLCTPCFVASVSGDYPAKMS